MRIRPCRECRHPVVLARVGGRWLPFDAAPVQDPLKHSGRHYLVSGSVAVSVKLRAAGLVADLSISEEDAIADLRANWPWWSRHMCRSDDERRSA